MLTDFGEKQYIIIGNIIFGVFCLLGYIKAFKPEMKIKDYELYRGVYCSLCRVLGREYTPLAQLFLSYDFAFAAMLRLSVGESGCRFTQKRCPYNPTKKCMICFGRDEIELCAHALIITVYYKLIDDLHDRAFLHRIVASLLFPAVALMHKKAARLAPEAEKAIGTAMKEQSSAESDPACGIDRAADPTATALGELFSLGFTGERGDALKRLGYMTGRFVYILDAADDLEDDKAKKGFNPFIKENPDLEAPSGRREFAERITGVLNLTQEQAIRALEQIKPERFGEILENIVYDGFTLAAERVTLKYLPPTARKKDYTVD